MLEQGKARLIGGDLRNSQGKFIFDPALHKWMRDPFASGHNSQAMDLDIVKWSLAHTLIGTMSFQMRERRAFERASLEAANMGDEAHARSFAGMARKISDPASEYVELDKGYRPPQLIDFKLAANGLVLASRRRAANGEGVNGEGTVVETVRNEVIEHFSFDLSPADLPPLEQPVTSRRVGASERGRHIIGIELYDFKESVLISAIYFHTS